MTFTHLEGTWIATKYKEWKYDCVKVGFKDLYQDKNGNYVQDLDEPFSSASELPLGDYEARVKIIYFGDEEGSGNLSAGDTIFEVATSDSQTFTLTDWPIIYRFRPVEREAGLIVSIIGYNFGDTQGDSSVNIGPRTFGPGHPRIKLWGDTKIRVRIPKYTCEWFKSEDFRYRKVWITVGGIDSNKKRLKVIKPATCP